MAGEWKITAPVIAAGLPDGGDLMQAAEQAMEEDGELRGLLFHQQTLAGFEGRTLEISGCRFERCTFSGLDFKRYFGFLHDTVLLFHGIAPYD